MICFVILFFFIFPAKAAAVTEFTLAQEIEYVLADNGDATVNHQFQLTNNFSQIYATNYTLELTGDNLGRIIGTDKFGNIITNTQNQNGTTKIELKFNQPSVGKNKTTDFTLNYKIIGLAKAKGNTWEISLPEPKNINPGDVSQIHLDLPQNYGNLSFASAEIKNTSHFNNRYQLELVQTHNSNRKILLTFGSFQLFDFNLNYFLKNDTSETVTTTIPIPPETNYQKIVFKDISPGFEKISSDMDGNWLLTYKLAAFQTINVLVSGQAKILNTGNTDPQPDISTYTAEKKFWPVHDSNIQLISQNLNTPRQIYDFVVTKLNYNYEGLNQAKRQGALLALLEPDKSLCTEFSDLFITLARARKIPAREVEGYAYTNNSKIKPVNPNTDILHSWPQYYDLAQNRWISIDPTWGKTTNGINYFSDLDLNHLALVFHGQDSQQPPPPGSYKDPSVGHKTVNIDFALSEIKPQFNSPTLKLLPVKFNQALTLEISNPNPNLISSLTISAPKLSWQQTGLNLLPFEKKQITIPQLSFLKSLPPSYSKINFSINSDQLSFNTQIMYPPHYQNLIISIVAAIIIVSFGGIILTSPRQH